MQIHSIPILLFVHVCSITFLLGIFPGRNFVQRVFTKIVRICCITSSAALTKLRACQLSLVTNSSFFYTCLAFAWVRQTFWSAVTRNYNWSEFVVQSNLISIVVSWIRKFVWGIWGSVPSHAFSQGKIVHICTNLRNNLKPNDFFTTVFYVVSSMAHKNPHSQTLGENSPERVEDGFWNRIG